MTRILVFAFALGLLVDLASADNQQVDFNREIRAVLFDNCVTCHGPDENERAAGLRLDTRDGAIEDLGGYAAIVPGDADASELMARVLSEDPDIRMPPPEKGPGLDAREVKLLRRWIGQGAAFAEHWSYQPPRFDGLPDVTQTDWPKNEIDYFVLAKLESVGLRPSPAADRRSLARRVALDLTGLPPTWEEATAFAEDTSPNAYERFVDSQLQKSSFGERWARVWLDLARYADSAGYADDPPRTIWAFRDYVIRSLNQNKPFDQFTIEQIAGDLLDDPTDEQLIATAFHRNTLTNNEGGTNDEEFRNVAVVDRVNTTMAVWMGTTMACAQCHTHKYDPITQEEYFRFFAILNNTADADRRNESPTIEVFRDSDKARRREIISRQTELRRVLATQTNELDEALHGWLAQWNAPPTWNALTPSTASSNQRELQIDDQWVVANGEPVENANDVVTFPTNEDTVITGLQIEIPAEQKNNFVLSRVRAQWEGADHSAPIAKYVRLVVPGKKRFLHVAEIQVFSAGENVALKGKVTQSSVDYGGIPERVIDDNTDGDFSKNSVNHTKQEESPWVMIELVDSVPVDQVVVFNRTDGEKTIAARLDGYRIELLSDTKDVLWAQTPETRAGKRYQFDVENQVVSFALATADFQQNGFPAESVLSDPIDTKRGWAVAPQTGKAHRLTLALSSPLKPGTGTLKLFLDQESIHKKHVLNRFRCSTTDDPKIQAWAKVPDAIREILSSPSDAWTADELAIVQSHHRSVTPILAPLRQELRSLEKEHAAIKPMTTVPVFQELPKEQTRKTHIQLRGNYLSRGEEVGPGTPQVFHPLKTESAPTRMDLARWLVDPANPLTARVIANRHWEQLFGVGIVETSEEFGSQGELPSHPALLDWLAIELQQSGWDLKRLLKTIVMSASYQQSSVVTEELLAVDPFNRLLSRGPRFRISAEMVRDQALFVSGLLSDKMYGAPVRPMQPELGLKAAFGSATDWKTSSGDDRYRRGIYTQWRRSSPYPSMAQFDAPNREVCTVRRIRTNTPLQALVTLNDPVYVEAAQSLARKMIAADDNHEARIRNGFRRALLREPTEKESKRLTELLQSATAHFEKATDEAEKMATEPIGPLPTDAQPVEYAAWTVVANVILNLDELFLKP